MTTPLATDTGELIEPEDTGLADLMAPDLEPETNEGAGTETVEDGSEPEIEDADERSLFDEYNLDDLAKTDPKLKAFWEKARTWGRSQAEDAYKQKLAHETKQAEAAANAKAIETAFNASVSQAQDVLGNWAKREFTGLLKNVAANGLPDGWDYDAYLTEKTQSMAKAMRLSAVLGTSADRMKLLEEDFPGYKLPTDLAQQWTQAVQRQDVLGLDRAYSKAIASAARAAAEAELSAKTDADAAEAAKAKEKAKELRGVESARNGQARPTRDAQVAPGRMTAPEDLDRMPSREWARIVREEPARAEKMMREAEQVEERRRQRTRSA